MNTKVLFSIVTNFTVLNWHEGTQKSLSGDKFCMYTREQAFPYVPKCLWHRADISPKPTFLHSFPKMPLKSNTSS